MICTPSAIMLAFAILIGHPVLLCGAPPPRTDVYGDPLPDGVRVRMGTFQLRHAYAHLTFAADGRTLLSCGQLDGRVCQWNLATGRLLREMHLCKTPREERERTWVELGGRCAAMTMKDSVILRDIETGAERGRLPLKTTPMPDVLPSADGKLLAVKKDTGQAGTTIELWDVARGKKIQSETFRSTVWTIIFSPEGKYLALLTEPQDVHLWDTTTGKKLRTNGVYNLGGCFSPDGKTLAVNSQNGPLKLLDTATLKEQALLKDPKDDNPSLHTLEYSADGRLLAGINSNGILVWDVAARKVIHRLPEFRAEKLTFAPGGKTLACWGGPWAGSEIRLWDVASGKQLHIRPGHANTVKAVAVSPDGKIVASGARLDSDLYLWETATGRLLARLEGCDDGMKACEFSADGKQIVSAGYPRGTFQVWDVARAKEVHRVGADDVPNETFFRLSPDGRRLNAIQIGSDTPTRAFVWDLTAGKLLSKRPYKIDVQFDRGGSARIESHVAFAPDGQSVTVKSGQHLAIEDVKSGRILALLPDKLGCPVAFSPDGQLVAAAALKRKGNSFKQSTIESIRLIETATGQEVLSIKTGEDTLLDFSRDGRLLASIDENAIHIWDVATGSEFFRRPWPWSKSIALNGESSPATSLAFLPDGRGVVTGMDYGEVLIWDVPARPQPIRPRKGETLETLWTALAGEALIAHSAVYALAATPAETVPFLADRLKPATDIEAKWLVKRLADLDSKQFRVREAAQRELTQCSDDIEPVLRRFLENKPSLEVRQRIGAILASPRAVPPANTLRTLRAIRVLEEIGTAEARELLRKLADGAKAARQTREAKAALERLARSHENQQRSEVSKQAAPQPPKTDRH